MNLKNKLEIAYINLESRYKSSAGYVGEYIPYKKDYCTTEKAKKLKELWGKDKW